jgi:hypothetical protein
VGIGQYRLLPSDRFGLCVMCDRFEMFIEYTVTVTAQGILIDKKDRYVDAAIRLHRYNASRTFLFYVNSWYFKPFRPKLTQLAVHLRISRGIARKSP